MSENSNFIKDSLNAMKQRRKAAIRSSNLFARGEVFNKEEMETIFSQYWYPLNYFPEFLAKMVAILPNLRDKSSVARVLSEELGDGCIENAHEVAYFEALELCGIRQETVENSSMLEATASLMDGYKSCSNDLHKALGYFLSTEVSDLWIVSNLGKIMIQAQGGDKRIPWIDLHVKQEAGHVDDASQCLGSIDNQSDAAQVMKYAEECAERWDRFFQEIYTGFRRTTKSAIAA